MKIKMKRWKLTAEWFLLTILGVVWMNMVEGVADLTESGPLGVVQVVGPTLQTLSSGGNSQRDAKLVELHNSIRSQAGASNMEYVEYSDVLESTIANWTRQCRYQDAVSVTWYDMKFPNVFGFKATFSKPIRVFAAIREISQELNSIIHNTILKYDIGYIGCAEKHCYQANSLTSTLVACLYASRSPLNLNEKPFKSGSPCSDCETGSFWCYENLCKEDCFSGSDYWRCKCEVDCGGCSSSSFLCYDNCSCICPNGFDGFKCSQDSCNSKSVGNELWPVLLTVSLALTVLLGLAIKFYYRAKKLNGSRVSSSNTSGSETQTNARSTTIPSFAYDKPPPVYNSLPPYKVLGSEAFYPQCTAAPADASNEVSGMQTDDRPPPYETAEVEKTPVE